MDPFTLLAAFTGGLAARRLRIALTAPNPPAQGIALAAEALTEWPRMEARTTPFWCGWMAGGLLALLLLKLGRRCFGSRSSFRARALRHGSSSHVEIIDARRYTDTVTGSCDSIALPNVSCKGELRDSTDGFIRRVLSSGATQAVVVVNA